MKYDVVSLRRADDDVRYIVRWIAKHSVQGANAWLDAYDELLTRLAGHPDSFGGALESSDSTTPLKQALFRTRQGRTYRVIFTIVGSQVRILRVRGPGQPPLRDDEL
jgi:plasmid stabilization system protein ParE